MKRLLFIGDIVGEAGVASLEERLPRLVTHHRVDFVVANAENLRLDPQAPGRCGMTPELNERLFAAGVHLLTGGNHSWDGPYSQVVHAHPQVIRPLNCPETPGRGAAIIGKGGMRLGVVNLISPLLIPDARDPYQTLEEQLISWNGQADWVIVDFHGESVTEKQSFAHAVAGKVLAVLGTHTHVQTLDTQILPGGTAYVSDVGMTGPNGGVQGYAPDFFVNFIRYHHPRGTPFMVASGQVEISAVLISFDIRGAHAIQRVR